MAPPTVIFITGVARGIGKQLAATYLSKPDHVVIGSVRDTKAPKAEELKSLPAGSGSRLILVTIESLNHDDPKKAIQEVEAAGIDHIDIVVQNTGISIGGGPLQSADPKAFTESFNVNVVAGVTLFQAVHALLLKSTTPKWISISTRLGSIGATEPYFAYAAAYGISKAGQNWFTKALHVGNPSLTAVAIQPGFVRTDMGIAAATGAGIDLPVTTVQESADNIIDIINSATRENSSGKFLDADNKEEIPW